MDEFARLQAALDRANGGEALAQAARDLIALADSGHPGARNNVGTLYQWGRGVAADDGCARHYYESAAQSGLAHAQTNLAVFLLEGRGGDADEPRAISLFRKAAEADETDALGHLGRLCLLGRTGTPAEGLACWERAARLGDARGANNLAVAYAGGHGADADLVRGLAWFVITERLGGDASRAEPILRVLSAEEVKAAADWATAWMEGG